MKYLSLLFILLSGVSGSTLISNIQRPLVYKFENGKWFDGEKFINKVMYSKDGVWSASVPVNVDTIIDLKQSYIIPPLSEAHTHSLEGLGEFKQVIQEYLFDGVFYIKNPNNIAPLTKRIYDYINSPESVDASFANGGLTSSGGHPEVLYEKKLRLHLGDLIDATDYGWFKNKSYFNIDSKQDINNTWELIKDGKPDFIKIFLANSENFESTRFIEKHNLRKGLNPKLVPLIISKAHKDGFRVAAHVETRTDFYIALKGGVDEITHTPGFFLFSKEVLNRYRLSDEDAALAAKNGIVVITALLSRDLTEDKTLLPLVKELQAYNLSLLKKHNVKIAIGSDHAKSPKDEVNALIELDVFSNLEILKMWCETTPKAIFPNRKLGEFKHGYEASFIALSENPLDDLKNVDKINMLFKQGHIIRH